MFIYVECVFRFSLVRLSHRAYSSGISEYYITIVLKNQKYDSKKYQGDAFYDLLEKRKELPFWFVKVSGRTKTETKFDNSSSQSIYKIINFVNAMRLFIYQEFRNAVMKRKG